MYFLPFCIIGLINSPHLPILSIYPINTPSQHDTTNRCVDAAPLFIRHHYQQPQQHYHDQPQSAVNNSAANAGGGVSGDDNSNESCVVSRVFIGSHGGDFSCFNAVNGAVLWSLSLQVSLDHHL